jgi:hypothetical protein
VSETRDSDLPSSSISSSTSTSSPGCRESALISPRASLGRLKLVLRLDAVLADLPEADRWLDTDVRRDDRPEASAPVEEVGDAGANLPPSKSKPGISAYFKLSGQSRQGPCE